MGLFSKKEKTNDAPPVPPAQGAGAPAAPGAPPAPAAPAAEIKKPTEESNNLSAPPVPGGNLEEIKAQVAPAPTSSEEADNTVAPEVATPATLDVPVPTTPIENSTKPTEDSDDDSLFDFSELDVNTPVNSSNEDNIEEDINLNAEESKEHEDVDLSFIKHRRKQKVQDTYYVTTAQFKSLLEVVESVKNKVKDASETHLKLLDIKAEEDIEFENLRKDFQFVEDKLYEVDSIIFEK